MNYDAHLLSRFTVRRDLPTSLRIQVETRAEQVSRELAALVDAPLVSGDRPRPKRRVQEVDPACTCDVNDPFVSCAVHDGESNARREPGCICWMGIDPNCECSTATAARAHEKAARIKAAKKAGRLNR